jgi:oligopeptide transport system permease protein
MTFRNIGKFIFQTLLTTVAVMGVVIFLLGFLPDYATFEGEASFAREAMVPIQKDSFINRNLNFWSNLFRHDLGTSRVYQEHSVGSILRRDGMVSLAMVTLSVLVSGFFGGLLGIYSGYDREGHKRKFIENIGLIFTSLPSFLLVPLLIYGFAIRWALFPAALWQGPESLVLPVVALSIRPTFYLARVLSRQLLDSASADFVVTAKAKGLSRVYIWQNHILPNSVTAFTVGLGNLFGQLVTGSFLVETLFALPGLGFLFVRSLAERDYPVFLGLVLVFTLVMQIGHRLSDLVLAQVGETQFGSASGGTP